MHKSIGLQPATWDTPSHFAFVSNRIKFIFNNKVAISGPVHPWIWRCSIPIYLPFGIYPLNQARYSGFLAPSFATNEQLGLVWRDLLAIKIPSQPGSDNKSKPLPTEVGTFHLIHGIKVSLFRKPFILTCSITILILKVIRIVKKSCHQLTWYHAADRKQIKAWRCNPLQANVKRRQQQL